MSGPKTQSILVIGPTSFEEVYKSSLANFQVSFVNIDQAFKRMAKTSLIFLHHNEKILEVIDRLQQVSREIPLILILGKGMEKIAVEAMRRGIADCLAEDECIPPILVLSVRRALEHKKWQKVYQSLSSDITCNGIKDPLTGLYNRSYFDMRVNEEIARSQRYAFPLTLVYSNIEHFRKINQKFGILVGDQVLKELAALLSRNVRSSDLLARVQDDRFFQLLPHTTMENAGSVCNRMLEILREQPFNVLGRNFHITLKTVVISLNHEIEALDRLIKTLDEKMRDLDHQLPLILPQESH